MLKLTLPLAVLTALALTQAGCPKDEKSNNATPMATATAASGMATVAPMASPMTTSDMAMASPVASPSMSSTASATQTKIHYKWSGGLSQYQYYDLTIQGTETADVVFKVKPVKGDEKTVTDTLDAAAFAELKSLFDGCSFETLTEQPRKVRIMDIGERAITIERGGTSKKLIENGATTASADIKELRKWFDTRVRTYIDKSGVGPKRPEAMMSPAASPVASPKK